MAKINSTTSASAGKQPSENPVETHQLQCRALSIPLPVVLLFEEGEISIKEAWLLAYVDALVQVRGRGCWASNQYLADRLHVDSDRHMRRMIDKLTDMGLLKKSRRNGMRILETKWSRAAE